MHTEVCIVPAVLRKQHVARACMCCTECRASKQQQNNSVTGMVVQLRKPSFRAGTVDW